LLAAAALLGADPTMLVHVGVRGALIGAFSANAKARADLSPQHVPDRLRAPSQNARRRLANVGAIEIQSDASTQIGHHLLGQARIRTRGARLCTAHRVLDGRRNDGPVQMGRSVRVRAEHFVRFHSIPPHLLLTGRWPRPGASAIFIKAILLPRRADVTAPARRCLDRYRAASSRRTASIVTSSACSVSPENSRTLSKMLSRSSEADSAPERSAS